MSELNAEQIKKALECCQTPLVSDCKICGYEGKLLDDGTYLGCVNRLMVDALALIKELTEENERLRAELAKSYKALDEQMNFYCSFTKSKVSDCPINDEIAKAKADTAREIFDEIEKIIDKHYRNHIFGNNDLEDEEKCAIIDFCGDICVDIDKIKDKHHVTDANVGCKSPEARHETT